jgi:sarcosine oxidase subunit beta
VECCIVGAGVVGCATAWHLARSGHDVTVFEAAEVASGASGGLGERGVRANGRHAAELPLARRAHEIWPTLAEILGSPTGFRRLGHLQLIERAEDLAAAHAMVDAQIAAGVPCELVGEEALRELEPEIATGVKAAVHSPMDGVADHTATTKAFAAAAAREGVRFVVGVEVTALHAREDHVAALGTNEGDLAVNGVVLLAVNVGARALLHPLGVDVSLGAVYPQVIVTEPLARVVVRHVIGHVHRPLAIKTLPSGAVMITGGRLGRDGQPLEAEIEANVADAVSMFPALDGAGIERVVADRAESVTRVLLPVIDRPLGISNLFVATGWSGHGWAIAPAVAEHLARWIETGETPGVFAPFGPARRRDIS